MTYVLFLPMPESMTRESRDYVLFTDIQSQHLERASYSVSVQMLFTK